MKKKLITWDEFKKKFKPYATSWDEENNSISISYNGLEWCIDDYMIPCFGTEIEIEEAPELNYYTYKGIKYHFYWHDLWFEPEFIPIDFITEKDIEI